MYRDGRLIQPLRASLDDFAVYPGGLTGAEFASAAANAPCARKFTGDGYVYFGDTPGPLLAKDNKLPRRYNPLGLKNNLKDMIRNERALPPDKKWDSILDRVSMYSKSVKISGQDWMHGTQQESLAPVCTSGRAQIVTQCDQIPLSCNQPIVIKVFSRNEY